jgi:Resolvase, N terminal domain
MASANHARAGFTVRCAIYTRKSSDEGLEQEFNSLDAQREDCEAYIVSQRHAGWVQLPNIYDDGGLSGGTIERPSLKRLLEDIKAGKVQTVVVYKVDRLTRSLADFAKIVDVLDAHNASFVSVTQQFNTTTSMGRLFGREAVAAIADLSHHRWLRLKVTDGKPNGDVTMPADTFTKKDTDDKGADIDIEIPFMKGYTVFNAEQTDGLPAHFYATVPPLNSVIERLDSVEGFFASTKASIQHGGSSAFYSPTATSCRCWSYRRFVIAKAITPPLPMK